MKSPSSKTYILPTAYGICFAAVCLFLLAIAFASTNNAVYLLCFVIASLGVQSLVITNKNIDKVQVSHLDIPDFFADETGFAMLGIHNADVSTAENIRYELGKDPAFTVDHIKPGERRVLRLPLLPKKSGKHPCPKLKISSDFPFYFSRSWRTYLRPFEYWVYPARLGSKDFSPQGFLLANVDAETQDEFKGHRDYRDNDSPRSIDWKVTSRLQKVTVKENDQQSTKKIWLRWQDTPAGPDEDRRRQLSLWIDLADKKDFEYGLILPTTTIAFNKGPLHKSQCLRALL